MSNGATGIAPSDLKNYHLLEDFALSPDGHTVAAAISSVEGDELRYRSAIWLHNVDGSGSRRLTWGAKGDATPKWRPDGKAIAFMSDRRDSPQVHLPDLAGGDPIPLTSLPGGVFDFSWAPDGRSMVVVSTGEPDSSHASARRITDIHYKNDGLGLLTDTRSHLWLVPADGTLTHWQLTDGSENESNPTFAPGGTTIAFNRSRPSSGGSAPFNDIWVLDIKSAAEQNLTNGRGPCFGPSFSPDGKRIAFVGHTEPADIWWGKNFTVWTVPVTGGEPVCVLGDFEHIAARAVFGDPWRGIPWPAAVWTADGTRLLFVATVGAACTSTPPRPPARRPPSGSRTVAK
jgi:Tol biopolymer transport system component